MRNGSDALLSTGSTDLTRPIRARAGHLGVHFGRSELYRETDSGAVSAGSNPAGGTAQKHKFEYSDNLDQTSAGL